jgi:Dolichyl-phosphate-mannose-protein mannosyltransferase
MNKKIKHWPVPGFFLLLLLIGIILFRDYGISWDEADCRVLALMTLRYVAEEFTPSLLTEKIKSYPSIKNHLDGDHGVAFEAPAVLLEMLFGLDDVRDIFMFRHLLTFLVFLGGVYAVYRLAARRFEDWRIGLLAASFLVLSPRFFADSFYNSKDIVFMAAFVIAMNTMIEFVLNPNLKTALLHALATGFAIDVRIMGIAVLAGTIGLLLIKTAKKELPVSRAVLLLSIYLVASCVVILGLWPWLWSNPLANFALAFERLAHFRWNGEVLYRGNFIKATQVPWHYSLVWISITTPLLYLGLFLVGFAHATWRAIKNHVRLWSNAGEMQDLVFTILFSAPILAVILLRSVLYDGWRQLYFVYPAFLLIAIKGLVVLWNARGAVTYQRIALASGVAISVIYSIIWMWNAHPLQNVYFNMFAGNGLRNRYDMDYWGVGNRRALEYILAREQSPVINIVAHGQTPLEYSLLMLKPEERGRIKLANDNSGPFYVLTNYRGVRDVDDSKYSRDYHLFYQTKIGGEVIISVYKRNGG